MQTLKSDLAIEELASIVSVAVEQTLQKLNAQPSRTHYSVEEVAKMMGVTKDTIYGEIDREKIIPVRVGKAYRINIEQIRKLGA